MQFMSNYKTVKGVYKDGYRIVLYSVSGTYSIEFGFNHLPVKFSEGIEDLELALESFDWISSMFYSLAI